MVPFRSSYWHIEPVILFYLLAALSVGIFAVGLFMHLRVWLKGIRRRRIVFSPEGICRVILDGLLGRRIFRGDISAGLMHLLILWGFAFGGLPVSVQTWIIKAAPQGVEAATGLNTCMFNLAIALGALFGSLIVGVVTVTGVLWVAAVLVILTSIVVWGTKRI